MRLIDADALKIPSEEMVAKMIINSAPSIDIVQCKECKHYFPYQKQFSREPRGDGVCTMLRMTREGFQEINVFDDHFCSYGEREGE